MLNHTKRPDVSNQLLLKRSGSGIQLIRPEAVDDRYNLSSVSDLLSLPINIYWSNSAGITEKCNDVCANNCGYDSGEQLFGKSVFDIPGITNESATAAINHNNKVIFANKIQIFEEEMDLITGYNHQTLSIKLPWYDDNNNTIGIFGCSVVLGKQPLAKSLTHILRLGLLNVNPNGSFQSQFPGMEFEGIYFTKREYDCLRLVSRGKTAKEIALFLGLSRRTVEHYLVNLKSKMKVNTKSELVDKAIEYFHNT